LKAGAQLGWKPELALEDGVRRMVDWYRVERGWASRILTP
jgi:dTDP-D-glucose 4,6-dehydratase